MMKAEASMSKLELVSLLVSVAALFGWMSKRWLRLPITIGTMLLTVCTSLGLLGLRQFVPEVHERATAMVGQIDFENLILHGMLSLLLFAGSFLLDLRALAREKLAVALLALPGTLLSTLATALLMWWVLPLVGLRVTPLHALFFGALMSPTDPIAVLEMLRRVGVPVNVQAQLAGESLFNDGIGAVFFLVLLDISRGAHPTAMDLTAQLVLKAGGGLALGVAMALLTSRMMRLADAYQVEILLSLALALGVYAVADRLHLSAPLAAVAAGIALRRFNLNYSRGEIAHESIDHFWEVIDEVQNAVLFVLLGLELLVIPFGPMSLRSGGVAIVVAVVVRALVVVAMIGLLRLLQPGHASSISTLTLGGLRGGLSLALALSIPAGEGRNWILVATYSVVLFSILVQGGMLDILLGMMRPSMRNRLLRRPGID